MRLRLDLSYDGGGFRGWARQLGLRTVQGDVEDALALVLRLDRVPLTVAGRTDTGVHARGQVAHLDVDPDVLAAVVGRGRDTPVDAVRRRVNGVLGPDVHVRAVSEAPEGFDARFSASWRRYAYRIADHPQAVDPLTRGHVLLWPRPLDLEAMNTACEQLLGEHDFASFCRRKEGRTTTRTLRELHWRRGEDGVATATVVADAFCHHMVRSLVGCLLPVGEGQHPTSWPAEALSARTRLLGIPTARALGLTLEEVGYPDDTALAARARETRRVRVPEADPDE